MIAARRRRTPGLRREEVAQLAGLSTTWYTWIEQGRDVSVSPHALARLARTLRLDRAQRTYLFELAGKRDPDPGGSDDDDLPPAVLACLAAIVSPAYVLDRNWEAGAGMRRPSDCSPVGSIGRQKAMANEACSNSSSSSQARASLICDWENRARRVTAEFRAHMPHISTTGPAPSDRRARPRQRRVRADVGAAWRARPRGRRAHLQPPQGRVPALRQVTFELAGHADFKLTILVEAARAD